MTSPSPDGFRTALAHWRKQRRMTKKALAEAMGFDPSYVSHVESGRYPPSEEFARLAEQKLSTGGELWRSWQIAPGAQPASTGNGELFVDLDHAELRYHEGTYTASMRRHVVNGGNEPVTRYLVRISVDRYPGRPELSNELYRNHPLTWEQLRLTASCDGEPMAWVPKHDRDSFKEVWLSFENENSMFPLYPGQSAVLEYSYIVGSDQWGQWFQRAIRLPTRAVGVELCFPASMEPGVWGTETSSTAAAVPLRSAIQRREEDGEVSFTWHTNDPPIGLATDWSGVGETALNRVPRPALRFARPAIVCERLASYRRAQNYSRGFLDLSIFPRRRKRPKRSSTNCIAPSNGYATTTTSARAWGWPRHRSTSTGRPPSFCHRIPTLQRWSYSTRRSSASPV